MPATPQSRPVINVAAGIVRDAAGRVLVNQRPPGKPFAGRWEFPGGKISPGETAAQALDRELDEELGITIRWQRPLITFPYCYEEFDVRLRVNEVLDYEGVPSGWEGQSLDWAAPDQLDTVDLLEANTAIIRAIVLPRICLITDAERFGALRTLDLVAEHARSRRVLVIVREKTMADHELEAFVASIEEACRPRGSVVSVHADCAAGLYEGTGGVHLSARALEGGTLPKAAGPVGVSCHSEAEIHAAARLGVDYALLSPVKPTASHPRAEPLGWRRFRDAIDAAPLPVYALGGMTFEDQDTAIQHGAQGVAVLSAAWQ